MTSSQWSSHQLNVNTTKQCSSKPFNDSWYFPSHCLQCHSAHPRQCFQPWLLPDPFCEVPPQWLSLCGSPCPFTQATLSAGFHLKNCSTQSSGADKPNECSPIFSDCSSTHHFLVSLQMYLFFPIYSPTWVFFRLNIHYYLYSERTDPLGCFVMTTNTF